MTPCCPELGVTPHLTLIKDSFQRIRILSFVALLTIGGTFGWVAYSEYQQVLDSEYRVLEANARNADVQISETLNRIKRLLNQIAEARTRIRSPQHDKAFIENLVQYKRNFPLIDTLLVSDAAGRIGSATDATLVGMDISKEQFFIAQLNHSPTPRLFISRPRKSLLGVTQVTFSLPISDNNHQFLGVVGVTVGYKFFPGILQAINSDDSDSMSVIYNRDGDLLYRRIEPEKFFGYNIVKVSTIFHEHANSGRPVTRHIGPSAHNGKLRLFIVHEVGDTGIGLILSRQLDTVLAMWWHNTIIYTLIFIFTIGVWVALMRSIARRKVLEADLDERNKQLRIIEQREILSNERQRLVQDMHDGLGSSLVSALRVVEHGQISEAEVAEVLKGCIDDLKLAIDSMEPVEADLLLLLATLRYRLGPRLESTGVTLHWEVKTVPDLNWLDPKNALHILRILQETFTNIIKHTHATEIRVITRVNGNFIEVTIADNGQGFVVKNALSNGGKGLSNQLRRAEAIGSKVHWESNSTGTTMTLMLPIKTVDIVRTESLV